MAPAWVLLDRCADSYFDEEDDGSAAAAVEAVFSKDLPMFQTRAEITVALLGSMKPDLFLPEPPEIATFRLLGSKTHLKHDVGTTSLFACADKNLLVLYGGKYSGPGLTSTARGCYLVFDASASPTLVSTVPPVPEARYLTSLGAGTVVLRRQPPSSAYLLAELATSPSRGLPDAEFYLWRSDDDQQWVRKEVRLPREVCWEPGRFIFSVDTSFTGPGTDTLCWVDLLHGIVLCSNPEDDEPVFSLIRLPDDCPALAMSDDRPYHPHMEEYRSVACVRGAIKLVAVVGVLEGWSPDQFRLTTWTLLPDLREWRQDGSFPINDLWNTEEYHALGVPPCVPICPVLSLSEPEDNVVYAVVNDISVHETFQGSLVVRVETDFKCQCVLGIDVRSNKIISSSTRLQPSMKNFRPRLRATDFCASLQGKKDNRHVLSGRWKQAVLRMQRER